MSKNGLLSLKKSSTFWKQAKVAKNTPLKCHSHHRHLPDLEPQHCLRSHATSCLPTTSFLTWPKKHNKRTVTVQFPPDAQTVHKNSYCLNFEGYCKPPTNIPPPHPTMTNWESRNLSSSPRPHQLPTSLPLHKRHPSGQLVAFSILNNLCTNSHTPTHNPLN